MITDAAGCGGEHYPGAEQPSNGGAGGVWLRRDGRPSEIFSFEYLPWVSKHWRARLARVGDDSAEAERIRALNVTTLEACMMVALALHILRRGAVPRGGRPLCGGDNSGAISSLRSLAPKSPALASLMRALTRRYYRHGRARVVPKYIKSPPKGQSVFARGANHRHNWLGDIPSRAGTGLETGEAAALEEFRYAFAKSPWSRGCEAQPVVSPRNAEVKELFHDLLRAAMAAQGEFVDLRAEATRRPGRRRRRRGGARVTSEST